MASTQTTNGLPGFEAAFDQFRDLNDQFVAAARKAGNLYLESYEKAVDRTIDFELKVASLSQQEWLKNLVETQADLAREVTNSYTSTVRGLLK